MVDRESVLSRLGKLQECLEILEELRGEPRAAFVANHRIYGDAERHLQVAIECMLDIGNHILAELGTTPPETYRDVFRSLTAKAGLEAALGSKLEAWAGLRNVLVHLYMGVDRERIHAILQEGLDVPRRFADYVRARL